MVMVIIGVAIAVIAILVINAFVLRSSDDSDGDDAMAIANEKTSGCGASALAAAKSLHLTWASSIASSLCGCGDEPSPDIAKPAVFLYVGDRSADAIGIDAASMMKGDDACVEYVDLASIASQGQMSASLRRCNGAIVLVVTAIEAIRLRSARAVFPMLSESGQLEDRGEPITAVRSSAILVLGPSAGSSETEMEAKARFERVVLRALEEDGALEEEARAIARAIRRRIDVVAPTPDIDDGL